jgi:EAL domain-containing protein (putative c-di-GMP-specific phosphodiesterase class I)
MPFDVLKIDRSFIRDVDTDRDSASMVSAMTALAEGIETKDEWEWLVDRGCALGQGYYFSRPIPAAEILALHRRAALTVVEGGAGA